MRDPLLILDGDLCVHKANDAFLTAFQLRATDVVAHELAELDHGRWDLPKLRTLLHSVLSRRTSFDNFEVTQHSPRTGDRTFLLHGRRLQQTSGHRERILLGMQDVTVLHSIQTRVAASELRYRRLFETADDGILMLDPETGKITDANPVVLRMLGRSRKQVLEQDLRQVGLLEDASAGRKALRSLQRNGSLRLDSLQIEGRNGARHCVEFVGNRYLEGEKAVIQCNVRDITARREAEFAAKRLAAIVDSSQDAIVGNDRHGVVTSWNHGAERMFGYTAREIVGTPLRRLIPTDRRHPAPDFLRAIMSGRRVAPFRTRWLTKSARRIDVGVTASPIRSTAGDVVGISTLVRDITDRVLAETALAATRAQLAAHAVTLERMVRTRTAQLTATNRKLERIAESDRRGKEEYQGLLLVSQETQAQLRRLTHRLLTAQEEERRKISRELHDEVVQTLIGITLELSGLTFGASPAERRRRQKVVHIRSLVENSVHAVHRFARALRPAVLDDLGLVPAIRGYAKTLATREHLKIELTAFRGLEALDSEKRTVLFRVTQEALTNVARHARATRVRVHFRRVAGAVRLEIRNNGRSFPVAKALRSGTHRLGLVGMRERLEMVGGTLTIESARGKGTIVRAEIPFSPDATRP